MNFDAATIERMVREVLSQTQARPNVRDNAAPATKPQEKLLSVPVLGVATLEKTAVSNAVVIRERIITADLIKEQTQPGTRIVITKQAIVTPAAQDYLRNNRITFDRADSATTAKATSTVRWKILVSGVAEHTVRAIESVCRQQSNAQRELVGSAVEAATAAMSAIARAEVAGVIIVTNSPDVVACRANRNTSVRAAVATDLVSWSTVQLQLKPNVVCLSPQGRGFMETQNILSKVVTGPAPEVPSDWS